MRNVNSPGRTGLWLATSMLLTTAITANAADAPATDGEKSASIDEVVVTGSHIRRDEFTSASPVQIITRESSVLAGLSTTADILQGSTVTGGGQQYNGYFGGLVTDGGPGANTLSLRGLGAVRTLVLLNGRRLAPAGTRGSVGSADLGVLPNAIVDRIEILKDGASSTYGSDAVAGVVNIITKDGLDGFTLEGNRTSTFDGGGNQTGFSLSGGKSWDRGQLIGSFEYYNRSNLAIGQRDWATCPTQALIDPQTGGYESSELNPDTGEPIWSSVLDPETGEPKCFPISTLPGVASGIAHGYIVSPICTYPGYATCVNRLAPYAGSVSPIPGWRDVDDNGSRPDFDPRQLDESLISPTRNYTGFLAGSYDTGMLGNAEAYFEGLWTRRESKQYGLNQLSLDYQDPGDNSGHPFLPAILYFPGEGLDWGGAAINPFGNYVISRAFAIWGIEPSSQENDFTRLVGGLRGALTFAGDWAYDVNVTANRSKGSYTFGAALEDRVYDSLYVSEVAPNFAGPTRVGFDGLTYTCDVNIPAPGTGCVPAPLLDGAYLGGFIPQDYRDYIWRDITGHTTYKEVTVSAIANGSLFDLPYGKLKAALGVEGRWMELNDVPDIEMQDGNVYNFTSAGITRGKDNVKEIFGELEAPLLAGLPGAEELTVNLSGRYTDYDSYGSDTTYKIGLNYVPVKWVKLRATKGTSFRAPAIFERFLAPTSGFLPGETDPCNAYGDLPSNSFTYINCASEGLSPGFIQQNGVQVNSIGGAELGLKSEDSRADTVGIVFQPPMPAAVGDLSFAVDWWQIKVTNEVTQVGAGGLLAACYSDPDFRAGGGYCAFSTRDENDGLVVDDYYINIATQKVRGLDFNLRYTKDIGLGEFTADLRATRHLQQKSQVLPTDPVEEFNGTLLSPKWVGDLDLRYEWKDLTFYYGLVCVGKQDSNGYYEVDSSVDPYDFYAGTYMQHNVSVRYTAPGDWELTFGIRNLSDAIPKTTSPGINVNKVGNSIIYSGYDYFGRRAFLTMSKSF
jgi:outer membrane receptor protein involved in Fe transport